jgi:hypothetical protein
MVSPCCPAHCRSVGSFWYRLRLVPSVELDAAELAVQLGAKWQEMVARVKAAGRMC